MRYWLKHNWLAVVVLLAIGVSFTVSDHDSNARDRAQASQLVAGCKRTSQRAALTAYMNSDLAKARRERGEPDLAKDSDALADAMLDTIPAPPGASGQLALADVVFVTINGRRVARLTDSARTLQAEGCERAYR